MLDHKQIGYIYLRVNTNGVTCLRNGVNLLLLTLGWQQWQSTLQPTIVISYPYSTYCHGMGIQLFLSLSVCLSDASRSQRVSLIVIPFCLSVWMSVGHSATYSLPRLIDHNQIWSAGIYLSSDPCKPFSIPYLPYFRCQREKYARILATANVMHSAIWLVCLSICLSVCSCSKRKTAWAIKCPTVHGRP